MKAVTWFCSALLLSLNMMASAAGGNNTIKVDPPIPAPEWTLPAIENAEGELSLSQFKGKITYIDFWASWCGPCRLSLPALNKLNAEFDAAKVQFVAVSMVYDALPTEGNLIIEYSDEFNALHSITIQNHLSDPISEMQVSSVKPAMAYIIAKKMHAANDNTGLLLLQSMPQSRARDRRQRRRRRKD